MLGFHASMTLWVALAGNCMTRKIPHVRRDLTATRPTRPGIRITLLIYDVITLAASLRISSANAIVLRRDFPRHECHGTIRKRFSTNPRRNQKYLSLPTRNSQKLYFKGSYEPERVRALPKVFETALS